MGPAVAGARPSSSR